MTRSIILPVTLPNVYQFKKKLTSKFKDKFVLKQLITNEMLGCAILWFITNHNTYFRLRQFSDISISQDTVDSYVRCGRIFKYEFISNLPISRSVKEVWKSVDIWEFSVMFFDSRCTMGSIYALELCSVPAKSPKFYYMPTSPIKLSAH